MSMWVAAASTQQPGKALGLHAATYSRLLVIFPFTFLGSQLQIFPISMGSGNGDTVPTTISFFPSPFPFCSVIFLFLFGCMDVCADICSFHMQQNCCEGCAKYQGGRTKELSALSQCGRSRFLLRKQQNETFSFWSRADFETFSAPAGCPALLSSSCSAEGGRGGGRRDKALFFFGLALMA